MLRTDVNYPYPVLRPEPVDYTGNRFVDDVTVEVVPYGYKISTNFSVNDRQLKEMLDDGTLQYAVYIECQTTMLRKLKYVKANDAVELPAGSVHFRVNYVPYIIAAGNVEHFECDDFSEEYQGIDFKLEKGVIVGIGTVRQFKAVYSEDVISDAASIVEVKSSDTEKFMKVDLNGSHITVLLPSNQCAIYKRFKAEKSKYPLFHEIVTIPAIMQALTEIDKGLENGNGSEYSQNPWYVTLEKHLDQIAESTGKGKKELCEEPLYTAQLIMGNNSEKAFKEIEAMQ